MHTISMRVFFLGTISIDLPLFEDLFKAGILVCSFSYILCPLISCYLVIKKLLAPVFS